MNPLGEKRNPLEKGANPPGKERNLLEQSVIPLAKGVISRGRASYVGKLRNPLEKV